MKKCKKTKRAGKVENEETHGEKQKEGAGREPLW